MGLADGCIWLGTRYNPQKGLLTLVSEKYPDREENRRDILDTIHSLVAEGERAFPQTDPAIRARIEERQAAMERQDRGLPPPDFSLRVGNQAYLLFSRHHIVVQWHGQSVAN